MMDRLVIFDPTRNDQDVDGDTLMLLAVTGDSTSGRILIHSNRITYLPVPQFIGTDELRYQISDGRGGTASSVIVIHVLINHAYLVRLTVAPFSGLSLGGDIIALTGIMPEDSIYFAYRSPGRVRRHRQLITTASRDYSLAQRRAIRAYLEAFHKTAPGGMFFGLGIPKITVSDDATTAVAETSTDFQEPIENGVRFWPSSPIPVLFRLERVDETWLITNLLEVLNTIGESVIGPFPEEIHPPVPVQPVLDVTISLDDSIHWDLTGDVPMFEDQEGDSLRFTFRRYGTVTACIDGTVLTVQAHKQLRKPGPGTVVVTADDGHYGRSISILNVDVTPRTYLVAVSDTITLVQNKGVEIYVLRNDRATDLQSVRLHAVTPGDHSDTVWVSSDSTVYYHPQEDFFGTDRFLYTAVDGFGNEASGMILVRLLSRGKPVSPDFDQNGIVDFRDFLLFAAAYGSEDRRYDLNEDGQVGFADFLQFAQAVAT